MRKTREYPTQWSKSQRTLQISTTVGGVGRWCGVFGRPEYRGAEGGVFFSGVDQATLIGDPGGPDAAGPA